MEALAVLNRTKSKTGKIRSAANAIKSITKQDIKTLFYLLTTRQFLSHLNGWFGSEGIVVRLHYNLTNLRPQRSCGFAGIVVRILTPISITTLMRCGVWGIVVQLLRPL